MMAAKTLASEEPAQTWLLRRPGSSDIGATRKQLAGAPPASFLDRAARHTGVWALALLVTVGCDVEAGGDGADVEASSALLAPGLHLLANSAPMGLFAWGSSLYWTSQDIDDVGPDFALVWSCASDNTPGFESLLRQDVFDPNSTSFNEYDNIVGASV